MIELPEPRPASVVLAYGRTGTAYQRFYSDHLWHAAGGLRPLSWENLNRLSIEPLIVIYSAPPEGDE